uniref:Uncharacterized protein n=1 Tax=Leersia perrieri TaxID=77586 RepID=A0A0D9XTK4_9ORYZ
MAGEAARPTVGSGGRRGDGIGGGRGAGATDVLDGSGGADGMRWGRKGRWAEGEGWRALASEGEGRRRDECGKGMEGRCGDECRETSRVRGKWILYLKSRDVDMQYGWYRYDSSLLDGRASWHYLGTNLDEITDASSRSPCTTRARTARYCRAQLAIDLGEAPRGVVAAHGRLLGLHGKRRVATACGGGGVILTARAGVQERKESAAANIAILEPFLHGGARASCSSSVDFERCAGFQHGDSRGGVGSTAAAADDDDIIETKKIYCFMVQPWRCPHVVTAVDAQQAETISETTQIWHQEEGLQEVQQEGMLLEATCRSTGILRFENQAKSTSSRATVVDLHMSLMSSYDDRRLLLIVPRNTMPDDHRRLHGGMKVVAKPEEEAVGLTEEMAFR